MTGLGAILGQNRTEGELLAQLALADVRICRLTGPSGSGKSHIALDVAAAWQELGGRALVAVGDDLHSSRALHPFLAGMALVPTDWRAVAQQTSRSMLQVADAAGGTGGAGTSVFDLLSSTLRQRGERALRGYSGVEREILLDLRRLARTQPVLLVADNAHWWDEGSLWLLAQIISDELHSAIPALARVTVLLVDTADEQAPTSPVAFDVISVAAQRATWRTRRCRPDEFRAVLAELGLEAELPDELIGPLYVATGGHLKVSQELVRYAERSNLDTLVALGPSDYVAALISSRLADLGASGGQLVDLLQRASVIGLSFDERELSCLAEGFDDLEDLLAGAEQIAYLERVAGRVSFSHEVLRSAFLRELRPAQLRAHRRQLETCISMIRPGDYLARADLLLSAGERERGRDLLALACVQQIRRGTPLARLLRLVRDRFADDQALEQYLEVIASGYLAIESGEFSSVLPALRTPMGDESPLVASERTYVAAICLNELQTQQASDEARGLLTAWQRSVREEIELNLRYLLLIQQVEVHADRFEDARETEMSIERRLLARSRHDGEAAVLLQVQNRRSASIHGPDVAVRRIQRAVDFFRQGTGERERDRRELFRSLNNLVAIQLRLGRDAEAFETATEAEAMTLEQSVGLPRIDVLASNLVLAAVRSGTMTPAVAAEHQQVVIDSPDGGGDMFIQRCNLAGYKLLAGDQVAASALLAALRAELERDELTESYLVFYSRALEVAAALIAEEHDRASQLHARLQGFIDGLRWPCAAYVRRRHMLLAEAIAARPTFDEPATADRVLLDEHPMEIGEAWAYYGRLVPCCELSYWSDS